MTGDTLIGRSVRRVGGVERVTGAQRYTADLQLDRQLHVKLVSLDCARGRIAAIDTSAAARVDGVRCILTAGDLPQPTPRYGPVSIDRPVIAVDETKFFGEPVAAVAADTLDAAEAAAALVRVDYEPLPAVLSVADALDPAAPLVREPALRPGDPLARTNTLQQWQFGWGDTTAAATAADLIVERDYTFPMVTHFAIEPHAFMAAPDPNGLTVWSPTQHPFVLQRVVAAVLGWPLAKVRIVAPDPGGGFGGKGWPKFEPLVAFLALRTNRPVRLVLSLEETFQAARRTSANIHARTGFDRSGRILFQEIGADFLLGAYADIGVRVVSKASYAGCGPYRTPHARVVARALLSHTTPSTAFRGFGTPQMSWATESQLNEAAHALGLDPFEIRARNVPVHGEVFIPGDTPADGDWQTALATVKRAIGWTTVETPTTHAPAAPATPAPAVPSGATPTAATRADSTSTSDAHRRPSALSAMASSSPGARGEGWSEQPRATSPSPKPPPGAPERTSEKTIRRAQGVSLGLKSSSTASASFALARLHFDGSATILSGTSDMGQGARTVLAQVAAEELGIPLDRIAIVMGDTAIVPYDSSTSASRSSVFMGHAVLNACRDIKVQLRAIAAETFALPEASIVIQGGRVRLPEGDLSYGDLLARHFGSTRGEVVGMGHKRSAFIADHPLGGKPVFWELMCAAADVEVDVETGMTRLLRVILVSDIGKALNPQQVEAQDEGAAVMGLGHTLMEQILLDADGRIRNLGALDYRIPTIQDTPRELTSILIENGDGPGPFGAKGAGEGGILAIAAAVGAAINDAAGVTIRDLPLTPERVWRAIRDRDLRRGDADGRPNDDDAVPVESSHAPVSLPNRDADRERRDPDGAMPDARAEPSLGRESA